jgi:hypothetical protein
MNGGNSQGLRFQNFRSVNDVGKAGHGGSILPAFEAWPFRKARRRVRVNRVGFNLCLVLENIASLVFVLADGQRRLGKRLAAKYELRPKRHLLKFHLHTANGRPGVKASAGSLS